MRKLKLKIIAMLTASQMISAVSVSAAVDYYVKDLIFPDSATVEEKIDMASRLVPDSRQFEWQQLGLTSFLHFGINTFTDREWGDGNESPAIFNPVGLDAEQWVKTLKDTGFKLVILTAKHHDGFCLWPTKTTKHSVAASPWKNGQGDVVRELRDACDKYGMKMGVYLSPWDRNAECYGDSPRYNDMFVAQLTELLTNYGKIDEVWFDGACGEGPNGKKQEYDWNRFKDVIKKLQPEAVVAIMGDDVRWVGNERGQGRLTEWSATAITPGILPHSDEANKKLGLEAKSPDLGGRDIVAKADRLYWWPSEVDVSIRPGWFYHDNESPRSLRELAEIYLNSVGRNSVLLLNVPPDRNGLIASADCERLMELKEWIDVNFSDNRISVYNSDNLSASLVPGSVINTVVLTEDISRGQRVEEFDVKVCRDGLWQKVASGTTIGNKRIITFPDTKADSVKIDVTMSRNQPNLTLSGVYNIVLPLEVNVDIPGYEVIKANNFVVTEASGNQDQTSQIFDNSDDTFWVSESGDGEKSITIDMKDSYPVAGFVYTPRGGDVKSGTVFHYRFYVSNDGLIWNECKVPGEFSNIVNNPIKQRVYFPNSVDARYVKFVAVDEIEGRDYVTIGGLSILKK